jgi:hypothetical protein
VIGRALCENGGVTWRSSAVGLSHLLLIEPTLLETTS